MPEPRLPFCQDADESCPEGLSQSMDPERATALAALGIRCRNPDQGMLGPVCGIPFAVVGYCMRQDPDMEFVQAGEIAWRVIEGPMPVSELPGNLTEQ